MSAVPVNAVPPRFANSPNYKWFATATVMMGMMGAVMSSTMLNVAIPNIMGTYGIGQDEVHWMSTLAAMPVLMLMNGWFVNNFGVRATYVGACVVFCVASLVGQFIPDYYGLVVIRTIQGGCTGLLQPLTMTVIFPLFDKDERGKAMGVYGMGFVLGPAMGPTFGGLIVDYWHWQDAFGSSATPEGGIYGRPDALIAPLEVQKNGAEHQHAQVFVQCDHAHGFARASDQPCELGFG